ncbi:GAF domain-containing protein [Actinoplanes sp. NPDC026619]|uniref:GAF domain-containing protein n=1 Tax=Actinoplanes sp. NPDC026619 TaxID=3155798 RepID=UPI00340C816B
MSRTDEHRRLAVLAGIDIDNPELRAKLDEVSARTAARLGQPVSLVSMVLDGAQFFAGSFGLQGWLAELNGTPIEWSFCVNAVQSRTPYVVTDARIDALYAANPLVHVDGLHRYAGVPIVVDGEVLGAHCVLGYEPGEFSRSDLEELRRGADEIVALLASHRLPRAAPLPP